MPVFANIFDVDLQKAHYPLRLNQMVVTGDISANSIGARVYDEGAPVQLTGTCMGVILRADGTTVPMVGYLDGNRAYVVLDQVCCQIAGDIQVAVTVVTDGNTTTLLVAYGTVVKNGGTIIVQPSDPIIDITQLQSALAEMRAATAAALDAASKSVRYDEPQTLTNAQKIQAMANAGLNFGRLNQYGETPVDIDTILDRGVYQIDGASAGRYTNLPTEVNIAGMAGLLIVDIGSDTTIRIQTLHMAQANAGNESYTYTRWSINGTWGQWTKLNGLTNVLASGTDLNAITGSGTYILEVNYTYGNVPTSQTKSKGVLSVHRQFNSDGIIYQILVSVSGGHHFRFRYNNEWFGWYTIGSGENWMLARGTDLNTLIKTAKYNLLPASGGQHYIHLPDDYGDATIGELIVNASSNAANAPIQILFDISGRYWIRESINSGGTWTDWSGSLNTYRMNSCRKNLVGIFHTIGVIGDSLASGYGRLPDGTTPHDYYAYSWPQCMARILNNTVYNFTKSGLTTETWLTDPIGLQRMQNDKYHAQCYIIGLGANDLNAVPLGEEADIGTNLNTYYANYARIISLIKAEEPNAVIFTVENPAFYISPATDEKRKAYNAAVRCMSEHFDSVYDIVPDEALYTTAGEFIKRNNIYNHYTPAAYLYMAEYLIGKMSDIIYEHPEDFFYVNTIDPAAGAKPITLAVNCGTVSSLPTTVNNVNITDSMVVAQADLSNPLAQGDDWTVTTSTGSLTISGTITGSTTIKLYLMEG